MECFQKVHCPECNGTQVTKAGFTDQKKQRYRCHEPMCAKYHFLTSYSYKAYDTGVKEQAINMAINGSGIRDTARVLNISRNTITTTIKKRKYPSPSQSQLTYRKYG